MNILENGPKQRSPENSARLVLRERIARNRNMAEDEPTREIYFVSWKRFRRSWRLPFLPRPIVTPIIHTVYENFSQFVHRLPVLLRAVPELVVQIIGNDLRNCRHLEGRFPQWASLDHWFRELHNPPPQQSKHIHVNPFCIRVFFFLHGYVNVFDINYHY